MSVLEGLLAGIVAEPLEETRWLVLADWLEEFDDPRRAELLRLHRKMLATCCGVWSVEGGGAHPVLPSTLHTPHSTVCEPSLHPDRAEWQSRMVALLGEGVRPCVPQETITLPGGVGMTFSFIPPGSFLMGSDHPEAYDNEKPIRPVTLTKGFFLGTHPVTQAQWRAITGESPSTFNGDNRPVEGVLWDDCQEFCQKVTGHLSGRRTADFPSEAEWEYACRAGTTTEFHFGDIITPELANYNQNYTWIGKDRGETTEVGSFPANPWGLFDMHGNIGEWCQDWYRPYSQENPNDPISLHEESNRYRVFRGGGWSFIPVACRAAARDGCEPWDPNHSCGFRCVFRLG